MSEREVVGGYEVPNIPKGKKALLRGDHPWAGHVATFVEWRNTWDGPRPVFDVVTEGIGSPQCFAMDPKDIQWI